MFDPDSPFISTIPRRRKMGLGEMALQQLEMAIIAGDPAPGSLISETATNARFAFGMAAIRGALARLAAMGWVSAEGRKGWRIAPLSAAHLADLVLSRQCLEPFLPGQSPPSQLRAALLQRAQTHRANLSGLDATALLHQERALKHLCVQVLAAPRLRGWLRDTWDLCLRADHQLAGSFDIPRNPLPLAELAEALAQGATAQVGDLLAVMRDDFADRCQHALSRSTAPLGAGPQMHAYPISPEQHAQQGDHP